MEIFFPFFQSKSKIVILELQSRKIRLLHMNKEQRTTKKGGGRLHFTLLNVVGYVYLCLKMFNSKNYPAITATIINISKNG